jgi:hypothetical protein
MAAGVDSRVRGNDDERHAACRFIGMNSPAPTPSPKPVDLARESVAGEEDPGASIDVSTPPPKEGAASPSAAAPGDEAPPGTPGSGEGLCPRCGGSGRLGAGPCPDCAGTGKVNQAIGGG